MREGGKLQTFLYYQGFRNFSLFANEEAYSVHLECWYLIKTMVVGFCWRCNWTVGSSINVLTNLILFRYQTTIKYTIHVK